jgi:phytanoyl-CoA hydroxylase
MSKGLIPDFTLNDSITEEQRAYFSENGVIIFRKFWTKETVENALKEISIIETCWLKENRQKVNGIPLKFGKDVDGEKMIQRLCFLSLHSEFLHRQMQDPRFQLLTSLLAPYSGRLAENEKDGLVLNHYVRTEGSSFTQMGWHTDSPRDLFLGHKIMPMLNVGIHLDECPYESGGLRVLPGTHKQGIMKLLFSKKYFIDNNPDPKEIGFDMHAGDLSVHDGRIWHRAQQSPYLGEKSRRRVFYIPVITGKIITKSENSKTPFYHRLASRIQN